MELAGIARNLQNDHPQASLADIYMLVCQEMGTTPLPKVTDMLEDNTAGGLRIIDLSGVDLSTADFAALAEISRLFPNLHSLDLSTTNLQPESVPRLIDVARENSSLTSLSLAHNPALGFSAAKLILPLIKEHKRIIELDVQGTSMAAPTKELIRKVILANLHPMAHDPEHKTSRPASAMSTSPLQRTAPPSPAATINRISKILEATHHQPEEKSVTIMEQSKPPSPPSQPSPDMEAFVHDVVPVAMTDAPDPTAMNLAEVKARNLELKGALLDHEERLSQYHTEMLHKCDSRKRDVKRRHTIAQQMMKAFQEHWKWPVPSDFNAPKCINDFSLHLTVEDLQMYSRYYTPNQKQSFTEVRELLEEMLDSDTSRRRRNVLIEDLKDRVMGHGPAMASLVTLLAGFCDKMGSESTQLEIMNNMMQETEIQLKDARIKLAKVEAQKDKALEVEDMQAAEAFFMTALDIQELMIDIILARLAQLLDKGPHDKQMEAMRLLCEGADAQMNDTKRINDELLAKIKHDLSRIKEKLLEEQEGMQYREAEFIATQQRIEEELQLNQQHQEKVWRDIAYAHRSLEELAQQRAKEVENWTKEIEKYERRKVDYNAMLKVCEDHTRTLVELMNDCNNCDQILRNFDDFIRASTKMVVEKYDEAQSETEMFAFQEQKAFLEVFRKYYLQIGELQFKKQKGVEELDRQCRNCEFQISLCKETLDPALQQYRAQLRELQERKLEVEDIIGTLQRRGDERVLQFFPHEDALRNAGVEFESPLLEMQEDVLDRRARVLTMRETFVQMNSKEWVEKEAEGIEDLVQHNQMARKAGVSSAIRPLSPLRKSLMDEGVAIAPDPLFSTSLSKWRRPSESLTLD